MLEREGRPQKNVIIRAHVGNGPCDLQVVETANQRCIYENVYLAGFTWFEQRECNKSLLYLPMHQIKNMYIIVILYIICLTYLTHSKMT